MEYLASALGYCTQAKAYLRQEEYVESLVCSTSQMEDFYFQAARIGPEFDSTSLGRWVHCHCSSQSSVGWS